MLMLTLLGSLFGCGGAPAAAHTLQQINGVSASCGESDRTHSYSFFVRLEGDKWLFDAECFTDGFENEACIRNAVLTDGEVNELFELLDKNDCIAFVENYKKPLKVFASDAAAYSFCMTFSDGKQYAVPKRQAEAEQYFYRLADKYKQ